jgi:hypothetical protein
MIAGWRVSGTFVPVRRRASCLLCRSKALLDPRFEITQWPGQQSDKLSLKRFVGDIAQNKMGKIEIVENVI